MLEYNQWSAIVSLIIFSFMDDTNANPNGGMPSNDGQTSTGADQGGAAPAPETPSTDSPAQ